MIPTKLKNEFYEQLAQTGSPTKCAEALGLNVSTVYLWRTKDPEKFEQAQLTFHDRVRSEVIETALQLGVGKWVEVRDPITDELVLDDNFEPVIRYELRNVSEKILSKLMDKFITSADGPKQTNVQINNEAPNWAVPQISAPKMKLVQPPKAKTIEPEPSADKEIENDE